MSTNFLNDSQVTNASIGQDFTSRRRFLASSAFGVGSMALASLLRDDALLATPPLKPKELQSNDLKQRTPLAPPQATALISLFMHGGPAHMDLFDPKPELSKHDGMDYSGEVVFSFVKRASKRLLGSPWKFSRHGECGTEISELLP
ncbi:MAG: DUF1501 domain-containing protein, partial [Planctomycetes bacterium]|nr:DUF1501 domain-containing protein [Planctomycetota bacterium]